MQHNLAPEPYAQAYNKHETLSSVHKKLKLKGVLPQNYLLVASKLFLIKIIF